MGTTGMPQPRRFRMESRSDTDGSSIAASERSSRVMFKTASVSGRTHAGWFVLALPKPAA